jgi:hypothetical protein
MKSDAFPDTDRISHLKKTVNNLPIANVIVGELSTKMTTLIEDVVKFNIRDTRYDDADERMF